MAGSPAASILLSAALAGLCAHGGAAWALGFVAWVPWLLSLDRAPGWTAVVLRTLGMQLAFTVAAFYWFGAALAAYTGLEPALGVGLLMVAAPIFQPQFLALALARHLAGPTWGPWAGAAAWLACEAFVPKLLGDSLGHGLYPSEVMRQGAEWIGVAGLTALLLLANEALAAAWRRRGQGVRAAARPLAVALLSPLAMAVLGALALSAPEPTGPTLRVGMVQSNIVDYERLRREQGAGAVVREVLDTHYAMTYDAVERQKAQAVLWSETVYPTTFARPKSEAGAELDREIVGIVNAARVPFVFGTYDRDEAGEYNAAAFVAPGAGLVGFYRKTRLFPFTEHLPPGLGWLRPVLPGAGGWRPGDGARVIPLRLADGREIPALPLICLDAVDTTLALDGARLGAQVILSMSNDSWFTAYPVGAQLHLAVAAFRSVETRLPQFRVTSNGLSAVIDARGRVRAGTRMGERTLVVGELPVVERPPTLLVRWGDWVGRLAALVLVLLAATQVLRRWRPTVAAAPMALPEQVGLLPPAARWCAGGLRVVSRSSLVVMAGLALFASELWHANTLAQVRSVVAWFVAPELAALFIVLAFRVRLQRADDQLVFERGSRRLALPVADIRAVQPWRWPVPAEGAWLLLSNGPRWPRGLSGVDAQALQQALGLAEGPAQPAGWLDRWGQARRATSRSRFDRPWLKFGVLPFVLAVPAFRLHQHIAFGGSLGEWQTFGAAAFLKGFGLWWAGWAIGVLLAAAALRAAVEAATMVAAGRSAESATSVRAVAQRMALALLYLGLPAWLAWRALGN